MSWLSSQPFIPPMWGIFRYRGIQQTPFIKPRYTSFAGNFLEPDSHKSSLQCLFLAGCGNLFD